MNAARATDPLCIFVVHASDLLTDHKPHGDGIAALGFLKGLAERGHRLHVAAARSALRDRLPENITIHTIALRFQTGALSRVEYAIRARILFRKLRKTIRFDIVQQMVPVKAGLSLGMIGIREPLVLGTYVARWPRASHFYPPRPVEMRKRLSAIVAASVRGFQLIFARALLVTAPAAASDFPFHRLFAKRLYEVHHGIDVDMFGAADASDESRDKRILFLGTLGIRKGILTLLEAFEIVHRRIPDAKLILVGTGDAESRVRDLLRNLSCAPNVELLGALPRPEVPALIRSASIYCAPAYGEPYATSLLEAMACGSAVVVTNSGGASSMVPYSGGHCVATRDEKALALALIDLLENPQATRAMGEANRCFVASEYTWPVVIERLECVYDAVRARPQRALDLASKETFYARAGRK